MSYWIPADEPPLITEQTTLTLLSIQNVTEQERIYSFQIEGPPHMGVFLSPAENMQLVNWTYLEGVIPESGPQWQNARDTYFIFFNYAYEMPDQFKFQLTIFANDPADAKTADKWLDIALVSHYLFHQDQRTEKFQELINAFPKWTYVQAWSSTYESWQF